MICSLWGMRKRPILNRFSRMVLIDTSEYVSDMRPFYKRKNTMTRVFIPRVQIDHGKENSFH